MAPTLFDSRTILACILTAAAACSGGDNQSANGNAPDGGADPSQEDGDASSGGRGDKDDTDDEEGQSGSGSGSDSSDGGTTTKPTVNYVPTYPGAPPGTGGPLAGGSICDGVVSSTPDSISEVTRCFFGTETTTTTPAATVEQVLECVDGVQTIHLRLTFDPAFNDNTYGEGSIGWPRQRGHWFRDLTGSDHAELKLLDGDGEVAMQFKLDYIEKDASAPSGYASQCTSGGDGNITVGDSAHIIDCTTSLDENLNARGYGSYTEDSPLTDEDYTVNPDAPDWDYRMVFEVWVDAEAFGDAGFSGAFIDYVHASPAKTPEETIEIIPGECPPCENVADYVCGDPPPDTPDEPECETTADDSCYEPEPPPQDPPSFCEMYPSDPACQII